MKKTYLLSLILLTTILTYHLLSNQPNNSNDNGKESLVNSINERLFGLGYLPYVTDEDEDGLNLKGVVKYDLKKAYPGYNLYIPLNLEIAELLDMDGNVVHSWKVPKKYIEKLKNGRLFPDGSLLILSNRNAIVKLDWDSKILFKKNEIYHHDMDMDEDGNHYAIQDILKNINFNGTELRIWDTLITKLNPDGSLKEIISIYDTLEKTDSRINYNALEKIHEKLDEGSYITNLSISDKRSMKNGIDIYHVNTVDYLEQDSIISKRGDLLICIKHLNMIAILDIEKKVLKWYWGMNELDYPHNPSIIDNGNILIFDNGNHRNYSRVIEYNPIEEKIIWKYESDVKKDFYSDSRSGSQRLENGNTLITYSNKGKLFEVTMDGEIVWEFYAPHMLPTKKNRRAPIFNMQRITKDMLNKDIYDKLGG